MTRIEGRIEPHLVQAVDSMEWPVEERLADALLTWNRLDVAMKSIYLRMRDRDVRFAPEVYANHIKAFSLGSFSEPGNARKNSLRAYIREFEAIVQSMQTTGFDREKSIIPLCPNGTILNGSHRLAAAIVLGHRVACVRLEMPSPQYDYRFFLSRGMSIAHVELGVSEFVERGANTYVALVWPIGAEQLQDSRKLFPNIVYMKSVHLNKNGLHNLICEVYSEEQWLGDRADNFAGAENKMRCTCSPNNYLEVVLFQSDSPEKVMALKHKIRAELNNGKHSIHITDTHEEAVRVAKVVLNEHALHFLNYGNPNRYESTYKNVESVKRTLNRDNICLDDALIDGSMVMAAYGLREANDVDWLCAERRAISTDSMHQHDSELRFHGVSKDELLFNPEYHFHHAGMKWVALPQLYRMKRSRGEPKDVRDITRMANLVEAYKEKKVAERIIEQWWYIHAKVRRNTINVLKCVGLYHAVRSFYRFVMRRQ